MRLRWFGRWWDRVVALGGHRSVGPVTLYGFDTAMHGAVNISTRWGYLCIAVPWLGLRGTCWRWYAYLSPNATPWAATWTAGPGVDADDRKRARVLRALWGHGYDCNRFDPQILDAALWAVEARDESAVRNFERLIGDRAEWLKESA